jgi:hypothetical protein
VVCHIIAPALAVAITGPYTQPHALANPQSNPRSNARPYPPDTGVDSSANSAAHPLSNPGTVHVVSNNHWPQRWVRVLQNHLPQLRLPGGRHRNMRAPDLRMHGRRYWELLLPPDTDQAHSCPDHQCARKHRGTIWDH